jgi:hypothetical protein
VFAAEFLCRLAAIVFQHEQSERRREIGVSAPSMSRINFSPFQNSFSRLTLVLWSASKIECLTIGDFTMVCPRAITALPKQEGVANSHPLSGAPSPYPQGSLSID